MGTAAGAGTADATGTYNEEGSSTGTAGGVATATGVGRSIARAVGVAAGSSSATGVSYEEPGELPPSTNHAGGKPRAPHKRTLIGIRIDGKLYFVTYQEAAEILRQQAEIEARKRAPEQSRKQAKAASRKPVQALKSRVVIEEPLVFDGIAPSVVADRMFRDLRDVFAKQLVESLMQSEQRQAKIAAQEQSAAVQAVLQAQADAEQAAMMARLQQRRLEDDQAAMAAAEMLLMADD